MEKDVKEKHTLNPLLFKLAIPLALSLAGIIISTLTRKPKRRRKPTTQEQDQMDYPETMSQYEFEVEEDFPGGGGGDGDEAEWEEEEEEEEEVEEEQDKAEETPLVGAHHLLEKEDEQEICIQQCVEGGSNSEEQIEEELRCQFASLEDRQSVLESQFYDHCNVKEQESAFQKLQIMCLGLKLESLESQNRRLESVIAEFRGAMKQVDLMRTEIKLLRRKAKKLTRANKECSNLLQQHAPQIQAKEVVSGSNEEEFHPATKGIKEIANQLHEEIKAVEEKLERRALEQKMEERMVEGATRLDNSKLFEQLQQLRDQWSADMEELIYLGRVNACLRREILVVQKEEGGEEFDGGGGEAKPVPDSRDEVVMELPYDEHVENCSVEFYNTEYPSTVSDMENVMSTNVTAKSPGRGSKKPRLLRKLKGWATGRRRCKTACGNGKSLEGWPFSDP